MLEDNDMIKEKVNSIIKKQKDDPRYNFMEDEQKDIDQLVYKLYNLNDDDITEVETWYERRYPNLINNE